MLEDFSPNYNSRFTRYAGQSLPFIEGDSFVLYQKNLKEQRELLEQNGWIDQHFTYEFNSLGFRCQEFDDSPTLMTLGCSFTMGTGLPNECIWPQLLSTQLNLSCANFGQAGGSLDTAFRLCHGYIDKIKPRMVVLMEPPGERFEKISSDNVEFVLIQKSQWDEFYKKWCPDGNQYFFNREKNLMAIEALCRQRSIKFISVGYKILKSQDLARDLSHRGPQAHKIAVEQILQQI
jgi:hypothetical protein